MGPSSLIPSAKIVGNMSDMKKLVRKRAPTPPQPRPQNSGANQNDINNSVNSHQVGRLDKFHQIGGRESTHAKCDQRTRKEISGDLFRLVGVVLNVLNVIAPGADLCANIKKLGDDPLDEMGITYQVRGLAMLLRIVRLRFFRNFGNLVLMIKRAQMNMTVPKTR